ncbi:MAG: glycosyltransferase 61 family protein [Roseobacter sp.]
MTAQAHEQAERDAAPSFPAAQVFGPVSAMMVPGETINRMNRVFGFYDDRGQPVASSDIRSGELTTHSDQAVAAPEGVQTVQGPVLFAGLALEQFGHVLINALGRLWALQDLPSETKLVYYPKRKAEIARYPHLLSVLRALGVQNDVILTNTPTRFDALYTATDLFGERYGGLGAPAFFDWLDHRWLPQGPVVTGRKLYVTRSKLGMQAGRYACEDHLEHLLRAGGYDVFAPEAHDLKTQITTFQSAEKLIFAEGSALHLFGMIRRPEQRVAVINRRLAPPPLITTQLSDRKGPAIRQIDVIDRIMWPPRRSDHLAVSTLDFARLRAELLAAELIDPTLQWTVPPSDAVEASLQAGVAPGQRMLTRKEHKKFKQALRAKRAAIGK